MLLPNDKPLIIPALDGLPATGIPGVQYLYAKYPRVTSNPAPVVEGQHWRVGADDASAVEVLGVGGAWVTQPSITMAVWVWEDGEWVMQDNWLMDDSGNLILTDDGKRISLDSQTAFVMGNGEFVIGTGLSILGGN
jgi:hypothetical protein